MRAPIVSLVCALATGLVIVPTESVCANLHPHRTELIEGINGMRVTQGLDTLQVDAILCSLIENRIEKLAKATVGTGVESSWAHEFDRLVADWEKQGFLATGDSETDVLEKLEQTPGFIDAALRPDASHIALGVWRDSSGDLLCVVYIIRRLIFLNPFELEASWGGRTHFTVSGESPYKFLRVRLYKGSGRSLIYSTDSVVYSVELETDESGRFRVTLPISRFGEGEYQVVLDVSEKKQADYFVAALTYCQMRPWERRLR